MNLLANNTATYDFPENGRESPKPMASDLNLVWTKQQTLENVQVKIR